MNQNIWQKQPQNIPFYENHIKLICHVPTLLPFPFLLHVEEAIITTASVNRLPASDYV
jgi:hypothetical protein